MADEFDPYYTWLGIPPAEQPADHYRLIGLRQFEGNTDVISNAVDQKMQFLRTLQVGKRSALSQKLLNEISAAGGCLLDPQKKLAYDLDLKAKEATKQAATQVKVTPARPLPKPSAVLPLPAAGSNVARPAAPRPMPVAMPPAVNLDVSPAPKKELSGLNTAAISSISWKLPVIVIGGGLGLVVLAVIVTYASGLLGPGEKKIASQPAKNVTPVTPVTPEKGVTKPSPEVTPAETNPKPAPEVVKPPKTKTPRTNITTSPPGTATQGWWKDPSHVERLLALQIGTTAFAELPDTASRSTLAAPLTAELWLRLHLQGDQPVQILGTRLGGEGAVPKGWGLFAKRLTQGDQPKDQLYVEFWRATGEYIRYPVALPAPSEWHHIALVCEPAHPGRIFIDGRPLEFPAVKDLTSSQRNLVLGSEMQFPGANFKAEVCGLRVSDGARYSQPFTPPSPLAMKPDEATFAALECRLMQPTQISGSKTAYPWLYGVGKLDGETNRIVNFQPLRYGTHEQWQGGVTRPSEELGWVALDAIGGHAGNDADHAAVRRWVAPRDGGLAITGHLRHFATIRNGDGVRARIVSSRTGPAGEWRAFFSAAETQPPDLKVEAGDTVDFSVDCGGDGACDAFEWIVDLKLVDAEQRLVGTWNSAKDFRVVPIPAKAGAAATFREPALSKAKWIQLENRAAVVSSRDLSVHLIPARLIAQHNPAAGPATNSPPLTLKPVPFKPKEPSPFGELPGVEPPVAAKKSAVPDAAALTKARAEVISVFGDDLKSAKSPPLKQELAQKIFDLVKATTESPTRYALLLEVRRLAVEGRDAPLATKAVEMLGEQFEVDLLTLKVKLYESLAAEGLTPAQRGDVLSATCELGYEALDADKFEALQALVAIARSMAVKAAPPEAKAEAKEFFEAYAHIQKKLELIKKAEQTLKTAPNEPGSNLILGLYHHFTRGDALKGLPLLAKGSNKELATAAKAREQNLAKGAASSLEEADAWFDAVATVPADYKVDVQRQALDGYTFLATSGTGLEKIKAEKRRDELATAVAAAPERKGAKRVRASDFPEFSTGMVGRVLVNGKDAGVLITFQPGRQMNYAPLNDILEKSKSAGLRVILEGFVSCSVAADVSVFQSGQASGPGQIISIRGNQVNAVGGNSGRSSNSVGIQLPPGEHLVQWAFDYAGNTNPRMTLFGTNGGGPMPIRYTRQQVMAARKLATSSEASLSD
ncbi:MAG: hypothetical protein ACR2FY_04195 [Pirellulaceae bacterium]